jgi:hypothetical protein
MPEHFLGSYKGFEILANSGQDPLAREREEEDAGATTSHHCPQPPPLQRRQSRSVVVGAMEVDDVAAMQWGQRGW